MILFQLVVNVGMVMGVMPITGIPLPFVTHGGASLVSMALGSRHPAEHQRPPDTGGVVTHPSDALAAIRPTMWNRSGPVTDDARVER